MLKRSLVGEVESLLHEQKPALLANFRNHFTPKSGEDAGQQKELNDYLRIELSKVQQVAGSTMQERECLRNDVTPEIWLGYFETIILPVLVRFDFPKE